MLDRNNNFDFLRFILASLVIVSHSYPLTGEAEILSVFTEGQVGFGGLAVDSFFALSGYFIFQSLQRSKTVVGYIWKRLLRLYPALLVLLLFTFIVIAFVYTGNHLTSTLKNYWEYAYNCLTLFKVRYHIKGVFESNPYQGVINGSLWTLAYEFTMYMVLMLLFIIRKNKLSYIILLILFLMSYFLSTFNPSFLKSSFREFFLETVHLYRLATFFLAGSLLTFFDLKLLNKFYIRIIVCLMIIASLFLGFFNITAPILIPILVIFIGSLQIKFLSWIAEKTGDISYGVYIYGFIVQQTVMNYLLLSSVELMLISLPLTYIMAYFSWHCVEKRMLKYKNMIS